MISKDMVSLGTQRSIIREIAAYGAKRKQEVDPSTVLDFSLGNPNVPAPDAVKKAILEIVENESPVAYNSYTASSGSDATKEAVVENLNKRFGTDYTKENIYMTCGAAASLTITLQSLVASEEDEIVVFAPFFPEYKFFIEARGAKMVMVDAADDFQIHPDMLDGVINKNTKAVLINSPNNPSGVVYSEETIKALAEVLKKKSEEYGHPIYIISDEPYRELVFGDVKVPFVPNYYDNTVVCYSWSKSLSLPGERIGYILVPNAVENAEELMAAVNGSGRILGFVCAPSMFQKVITKCIDVMPDNSIYEKNRDLLEENLSKFGYEFAKPDGAFYFFIKSPFEGGGQELHERAKEHDMLVVPAAGFGCPEYVRLSYCVKTEDIEKAIPIFEKLMEEKDK